MSREARFFSSGVTINANLLPCWSDVKTNREYIYIYVPMNYIYSLLEDPRQVLQWKRNKLPGLWRIFFLFSSYLTFGILRRASPVRLANAIAEQSPSSRPENGQIEHEINK